MLPLLGGQRNISSWSATAPPTTLPFLGFFGLSPQPQPVPFFNQENVPCTLPSALWNHAWNMQPQPVPPQNAVGRPILGRRSEPNLQPNLETQVTNVSSSTVRCPRSDNGRSDTARSLSPVDSWPQNTSQGSRKSFPPTTYPLLGVNTSIPPPPIVNLPRSKDSEYYFHPIQQTPCNPVELHVTNLDQSIDLREMKKLLMSAFREHVMVLHVSVFVQSDGTLAASVKVPSTQDAQYAISQLHRRKVGFKRIMIAYAHSTVPQNPQYIKNQIVSLLLEVPGHKMPLFTFRELFASRYLLSVSVSDLYRMRDVCIIVEENNGRTIALNPDYRNTPSPASSETGSNVDLPYCLRHSKQLSCGDKGWAEQEQPSLANVRVRLPVLAERVTCMINSHDNCLPLASLMECYAAEFEPLQVEEQGAPLEHLVTCIASLELVHTASSKYLRLNPYRPNLDSKNDDSIVMCVSPSLANQVNLFARELVDLLKMQPHCQLMFNRFIPAYHHHFGRQCRVADYGFTKLIELLETLPHVVQVMGEGNKRVVTLSHRAQVRRFTSDLLRVLKSQASKQMMVSELQQLFERTLGRPFDPVDYGLCYLEDLLSQLSANIVVVSGEGCQMSIAIPKREQTSEEIERTKLFAQQVIELLSHIPQCSMEFAKFIPAYHHHYGTQCRVSDFGFTKLIELFEAIPDVVKVEDDVEGVRKVSLTQHEKLKVLSNQMSDLVAARYPPGLRLDSVHSTYLWKYGYALKPSTYGVHDLEELLQHVSSVTVVQSTDGSLLVVPEENATGQTQYLRVLRVLWESSSGRMALADFEQKFLLHFQKSCGRHILETVLRDVVEVSDDWVQLTSVQLFARDLYHLLLSVDGSILLCSLETVYQNIYNIPLVPARLGFSSLSALLQAVNHVAVVTDHGSKIFLTLNTRLAAVGITVPSSLIRNGNHITNQEFCNHSEIPLRRNTSQSLLKGIHLKMNGDKARQEGVWHVASPWNGKHNNSNGLYYDNQDQPMVVNLPEPRTPPSKEECMALLSPAKFLPTSAFSFLPSPPDPSELPKPSNFNIALAGGKANSSFQTDDDLDFNDHSKRKLRLAAYFHTPMQYK